MNIKPDYYKHRSRSQFIISLVTLIIVLLSTIIHIGAILLNQEFQSLAVYTYPASYLLALLFHIFANMIRIYY